MTATNDLAKLIWGAALGAPTLCASASSLLSKIREIAPGYATLDPIIAVKRMIDELEDVSKRAPRIGQQEAYCRFVGADLRVIFDLLHQNRAIWQQATETRLYRAFEVFAASLAELGVDISYARFEVVDDYPDPYSGLSFWAMNYDETDRLKHGLDIGTRMKRGHLLPFYSESLLAHEIVHACFGQVASSKLARGFEEGVADIIGHLLLASRVLPWEVCANILFSTRLAFPQQTFWMNYAENLRQSAIVLQQNGIAAMLELLREGQRKGRDFLRDLESDLLAGKVPRLAGPMRDDGPSWLPDVASKLDLVLRRFVAFPQSLCVSPLAAHIATTARVGESFRDLVERERLAEDQARRAVQELRDNVFLVLMNEADEILFNESSIYLKARALRYLKPAEQ